MTTIDAPQADLIEVDHALQSMRDAGYDLTAAVGEPVDNSIEANASVVRVKTVESTRNKKAVIEQIAFADDGTGIPYAQLPAALKVGYSSRYGSRNGLGRFGMGLKLAALSLARRVDIYTRPAGDDAFYRTYFDLDEIVAGSQTFIVGTTIDSWPAEFRDLMVDRKGEPVASGTLVVFSKIDRIGHGGRYGTSLPTQIAELRSYLGRTYRDFINNGLRIELDGEGVHLHDPLFLLDNPRVTERYPEARGKVIDESNQIEIDGHRVSVRVTVVPEEFRWKEGWGGEKDREGRSINFHIPDNQGRISILRNGREIYYAVVPRLLPMRVLDIDRYIGIEVRFPAELDDYFQVRHVKRGAEPVSKLREELKQWLDKPIKAARKEIQTLWRSTATAERNRQDETTAAMRAAQAAEREAPKGQAGLDLTEEEIEQKIEQLLTDVGIDSAADPEGAERFRTRLDEFPVGLSHGDWRGNEMFEITHFNGRAEIVLNHRHPFITEIYGRVRALAGLTDGEDDLDLGTVVDTARAIEAGLDVLFMAYAKAENMHRNPDDAYDELRTYWGMNAKNYTQRVLPEL